MSPPKVTPGFEKYLDKQKKVNEPF